MCIMHPKPQATYLDSVWGIFFVRTVIYIDPSASIHCSLGPFQYMVASFQPISCRDSEPWNNEQRFALSHFRFQDEIPKKLPQN